VNKPVSDSLLASLSEHFGMLCVDGGYSRVEARDEEVRDSDELDAHRIAFKFARRHYGHLRMLINHLNQFG
jgi:hypothetical protein